MAFAQAHGKPMLTQPRTFINGETGEEFTARSVAFEHPTEKETMPDGSVRNKVCFVGFSRKLSEQNLTAQDIAARVGELNVVEYNNGNFGLCEKGSAAWEDINIGL
jgi:hypothetical protein